MIAIIATASFLSTLIGGIFALKFRDRLHLILGFSAGAIIGVAFFDLMPEALELATVYEASTVLTIIAMGFVIYMLLDRLSLLHNHSHEEEGECSRGHFGAGSISIHSFLDGAAVGVAFQISPAVGAVVASAILVHGFSDGINTVNFILKKGGSTKTATKWLVADAIAPVLGILSTAFFTLAPTTLGTALALFAGFFLYMGASDLLPESHHAHPTAWTTFTTLIGMAIIYLAIRLAGM